MSHPGALAGSEHSCTVSALVLVMMDIQMPVMNGYESSRAIRAMEEEFGDAYFRMVPILAMSANAYDEDVRACLDAGMNAHIAKPFQPDALLKLLCELIE